MKPVQFCTGFIICTLCTIVPLKSLIMDLTLWNFHDPSNEDQNGKLYTSMCKRLINGKLYVHMPSIALTEYMHMLSVT